jgi:ABC-type branched-subunit amino acid transport system permease subunit
LPAVLRLQAVFASRPELVTLATNVLILAMLAISFDLCWGYSGIMSFGQAFFFGVAGYVIALVGRDLDFALGHNHSYTTSEERIVRILIQKTLCFDMLDRET